MVREEFEEWLEEHGAEALDRIEAMTLSLARWVRLYNKALQHVADEWGEPGEEEEDDSDDPGSDESHEEEV